MNSIKLKMKRIFTIILILCLFMMNVPAQAFEQADKEKENIEDIVSSTVPKEGYVPIEQNNQVMFYQAEENTTADLEKKVVLIQDTLPWNTNSNEEVLNKLGIPYDKVTTEKFLLCDLSQYAVVIFANDQKFSAYNNYKEFKEYLEIFAELGGVIIFGAADSGWAGGSLVETLPGNIQKTSVASQSFLQL